MQAGNLLQGSGSSSSLTLDPSSSFDADTQERLRKAIAMGAPHDEALKAATSYQQSKVTSAPTPEPAPTDSGNFITNNLKSKNSWINLPTVGGLGGAAAGAAGGAALGSVVPGIGTVIGGLIGGVVGGFGGSAAGEAGRQKLNNEETDTKEILKQGAYGAAGEIAGPLIGKVAGKVVKPLVEGTGKLLTKQAEEAALKGINPSKTFLKNYLDKTGEDAAQTLLRHDLAGAGAQQIEEKAIKPLQESFDSIANKSGAKVDPNDILNKFGETVDELRKSPVQANQDAADHIEKAFESIIDKVDPNKPIDIGDMNRFRQQFDQVTKDFAKDPATASATRRVGSILRDVVQTTADKAGLVGPDGQSLKEVGAELNKLYQIHDLASLQDQVGRGKALGMMDMLAGGAGSAAGGVPGMIAGVAAKRFSENPKVVGFLSKMAEKGGQNLLDSAARDGQNVIMNRAAGQVLPRAATGDYSGGQPAIDLQGGSTPPTGLSTEIGGAQPGMAPDMSSGAAPAPQSSGGMNRQDLDFLVQRDMQYTGGKNIDKYKKMYETLNPQSKLSDTAIGTVNDLNTAISGLTGLQQTLEENRGKTGPIAGFSALNPLDTKAQTVQSRVDTVRQMVGKALEGGVLRKEDEAKYAKILPTIKDTPEVAAVKLDAVMKMLLDKQRDYINLQNTRGAGVFSPTTSQ